MYLKLKTKLDENKYIFDVDKMILNKDLINIETLKGDSYTIKVPGDTEILISDVEFIEMEV